MLKGFHKVIGYYCYTESGNAFCDGEGCIIAGSEELIKRYMEKMLGDREEREIIRKTTFGEIIRGIEKGGPYAFDEEAYRRFLPLAENNGLEDLPTVEDFFSEESPTGTGVHFMQIQFKI